MLLLYVPMLKLEIIELISKETGYPTSNIHENSTLLGDIGLDGDDAWDVLENCHEKYGLKLDNFDFQRYFRNEPCFKGLIYLYRKLKYKDEHLASNKVAITIADLAKACELGEWNNNV